MRIVVVYKFSVYNKIFFSKSTQSSAIKPGCTHRIYHQINNCRSVPLLRFGDTQSSAVTNGAGKNNWSVPEAEMPTAGGSLSRRWREQWSTLAVEFGRVSRQVCGVSRGSEPQLDSVLLTHSAGERVRQWRSTGVNVSECVSSVVLELKFDKRRTNVLIRNSD